MPDPAATEEFASRTVSLVASSISPYTSRRAQPSGAPWFLIVNGVAVATPAVGLATRGRV